MVQKLQQCSSLGPSRASLFNTIPRQVAFKQSGVLYRVREVSGRYLFPALGFSPRGFCGFLQRLQESVGTRLSHSCFSSLPCNSSSHKTSQASPRTTPVRRTDIILKRYSLSHVARYEHFLLSDTIKCTFAEPCRL